MDLGSLYEPSADEIFEQTDLFMDWFADKHSKPDKATVYKDKLFAAQLGSVVYVYGRVAAEDWKELGKKDFGSEGDATKWHNSAIANPTRLEDIAE